MWLLGQSWTVPSGYFGGYPGKLVELSDGLGATVVLVSHVAFGPSAMTAFSSTPRPIRSSRKVRQGHCARGALNPSYTPLWNLDILWPGRLRGRHDSETSRGGGICARRCGAQRSCHPAFRRSRMSGRWGERLSLGITRALAASLTARLPDFVVTTTAPVNAPRRRLLVDVTSFEARADGQVVLATRWTITGSGPHPLLSEQAVVIERVSAMRAQCRQSSGRPPRRGLADRRALGPQRGPECRLADRPGVEIA
jgi:hypothetical protein